jgi:serine/threonine protein kinase
LGDLIGRGAHGKVYRSIDLQTGLEVAIKMFALGRFHAKQKDSIKMEVDLLKKLDHPNIVKYVDTV